MSMMQITLSDEIRAYVDAVVSDGDYADASAFIEALIRADTARFEALRAQLQIARDGGVSPYSGREIVDQAFEKHRRQCA